MPADRNGALIAGTLQVPLRCAGLTSEHYCSILNHVNGAEFIRKVRKIGRRRGVIVRFVATHGKSSHGRLYFGPRFATVKDRNKEIGKGLLAAMLHQLEIGPDEF